MRNRLSSCAVGRDGKGRAVRPSRNWKSGAGSGAVLAAPLVHDPDFEQFPSRDIVARCYDHDHPAPAPACRCGLYAAIEGTLDSLAGYLLHSAHDHDPAVYAEVACTGRVFVDMRGVRAERIRVLRLAASPSAWPDQAGYVAAVGCPAHTLRNRGMRSRHRAAVGLGERDAAGRATGGPDATSPKRTLRTSSISSPSS